MPSRGSQVQPVVANVARRVCSVTNCDHSVHARGLCDMHGKRLRKTGSLDLLDKKKVAILDRFWSKVDPARTDGCALWVGSHDSKGYGHFWSDGKMMQSHHVLAGKPPEGMEKDHLCRNPACVWPEHLEDVTHRENTRRGLRGVLTTHCPQGHAYDEANTYIGTDGHRDCRECVRKHGRERMRRIRAGAGR